MFAKYKTDKSGKKTLIRHRVVVDCQKAVEEGEKILTEQSHKDEVNINQIIRRHGIDLIQKVAMMRAPEMQWDDIPGNDFQEAMFKVKKAQDSFDAMPSDLRKKFNNNPAEFLDYLHNKENLNEMIELGLVNKPVPEVVQKVEVINQQAQEETPKV